MRCARISQVPASLTLSADGSEINDQIIRVVGHTRNKFPNVRRFAVRLLFLIPPTVEVIGNIFQKSGQLEYAIVVSRGQVRKETKYDAIRHVHHLSSFRNWMGGKNFRWKRSSLQESPGLLILQDMFLLLSSALPSSTE